MASATTCSDDEDTPPSSSIDVDAVDLADVGIPILVAKRFARFGIRTVGDAKRTGRDRLLMLRGIGLKKVESLFEAIEMLQRGRVRSEESNAPLPWSLTDLASYLGGYPQDVLSVVDEACTLCKEAGYPVLRDSLAVVYADLAREILAQSNGDVAASASSLFDVIESSDALKDACAIRLAQQLESLRNGVASDIDATLQVPDGIAWHRALTTILEESDDVIIDEDAHVVSLSYPSLDDWVGSLGKNERSS